jgi:hypothetical protein
MRAAARIQPYQAQIEKIQADSVAAARAGNMPRAQELSLERASIYQTAGVKVSDMFIAPLTMLPAQLGLFFGVKRMSDLPLPSLAADTWAWLPSLAASDPMWLLPVMNTVAIQATLYMSLKDAPTEKGAHMINAFRILSLTGLPVMLNFSSVRLFFHFATYTILTKFIGDQYPHPDPVSVWRGPDGYPSSGVRPPRCWVAAHPQRRQAADRPRFVRCVPELSGRREEAGGGQQAMIPPCVQSRIYLYSRLLMHPPPFLHPAWTAWV